MIVASCLHTLHCCHGILLMIPVIITQNTCFCCQRLLLHTADGQDVLVVVQCAPAPQLRTIFPVAEAEACDSIKAFPGSAPRGQKSGKSFHGYMPLRSGPHTPLSMGALRQWRSQTALMWVWLLSSLVVMMFVPLFVTPGALLLASLTGAVLGVAAVLMHATGDRLAESGGTAGVTAGATLACWGCWGCWGSCSGRTAVELH
jgi:hypothetical protein